MLKDFTDSLASDLKIDNEIVYLTALTIFSSINAHNFIVYDRNKKRIKTTLNIICENYKNNNELLTILKSSYDIKNGNLPHINDDDLIFYNEGNADYHKMKAMEQAKQAKRRAKAWAKFGIHDDDDNEQSYKYFRVFSDDQSDTNKILSSGNKTASFLYRSFNNIDIYRSIVCFTSGNLINQIKKSFSQTAGQFLFLKSYNIDNHKPFFRYELEAEMFSYHSIMGSKRGVKISLDICDSGWDLIDAFKNDIDNHYYKSELLRHTANNAVQNIISLASNIYIYDYFCEFNFDNYNDDGYDIAQDSINDESIKLAINYVKKNIEGLSYLFENNDNNTRTKAITNYFKNSNNEPKTLSQIKQSRRQVLPFRDLGSNKKGGYINKTINEMLENGELIKLGNRYKLVSSKPIHTNDIVNISS